MIQAYLEPKAFQDVLERLMEPLRYQIENEDYLGIHLGENGAIYDVRRGDMEALIRPLWGLAPYWITKPDPVLQKAYIKKIMQGTTPDSADYWGEIKDYDQYIVEMPAICLFLVLHQTLWQQETSEIEREQVFCWLEQALSKRIPRNNWTFFKVLVRMTQRRYGRELDLDALQQDLNLIDTMYCGNGWYFDGKKSQKDYYIAFAFHFYGLLYAKFMEHEDPTHAACFIERATKFAQSYCYYFDAEGVAIPFGRSLTYRFAQGCFFSALIFLELEAIPWGEMKWILSKHLNSWMEAPIFTIDKRLSIGYRYENLVMAEGYNAPGSPYWSFKFFLLLATSPEHPFWEATPVKPIKEMYHLIKEGNMLVTTTADQSHVLGYPAGLSLVGQAHAADKYSKFVYSTKFGFSVAKAAETYSQGAFDNTLAIAYEDTYFRSKHEVSYYEMTASSIQYTWQPYPEVEVTTTIYPLDQWHVRVHEIVTTRTITVRDGGFSVPLENAEDHPIDCKGRKVVSGDLHSSILGIEGYHAADSVRPEPNTSLYANRTIFPYVTATLGPGTHRLISLVGGEYIKEESS